MSGSKKWVISDLHLGHKNILKYSGALRGGTTSEEHDLWIVDQWNSVVRKQDLVYVLGDVAFDENSLHLVNRLKGEKKLIRGNHDILPTQTYLRYFNNVYGLYSHKATFWMSHAPIHTQELRGRINLHGHVHQNSILLAGEPDPSYINCCVEMSYGIPQSLDDLLEKYRESVWKIRNELWNNKDGPG
jgi:calcineurin-like phosphoesterase family protein